MTVYLLDVSVLLAIHDHGHVHHQRANDWFGRMSAGGWATCPITENGFIRIASNPKYPRLDGGPDVLARLLEETCEIGIHEFWADSLPPSALFREDLSLTFDQLTDMYLVSLAIERGGKFATLDEHVPAHVIPGGADALAVIPVQAHPVP